MIDDFMFGEDANPLTTFLTLRYSLGADWTALIDDVEAGMCKTQVRSSGGWIVVWQSKAVLERTCCIDWYSFPSCLRSVEEMKLCLPGTLIN